MTIHQSKANMIVLDNQQKSKIKGGTNDSTDIVILEDVDTV